MAGMLIAALVIALPAIALAWLLLRRQPQAIFWFATALIVVASGYLAATGAAHDIYRTMVGNSGPAAAQEADPSKGY